jgi:hypothetical protein
MVFIDEEYNNEYETQNGLIFVRISVAYFVPKIIQKVLLKNPKNL